MTIARDLGREIEISTGLSADDRVIVTPLDGIADGDQVRIAGGWQGWHPADEREHQRQNRSDCRRCCNPPRLLETLLFTSLLTGSCRMARICRAVAGQAAWRCSSPDRSRCRRIRHARLIYSTGAHSRRPRRCWAPSSVVLPVALRVLVRTPVGGIGDAGLTVPCAAATSVDPMSDAATIAAICNLCRIDSSIDCPWSQVVGMKRNVRGSVPSRSFTPCRANVQPSGKQFMQCTP